MDEIQAIFTLDLIKSFNIEIDSEIISKIFSGIFQEIESKETLFQYCTYFTKYFAIADFYKLNIDTRIKGLFFEIYEIDTEQFLEMMVPSNQSNVMDTYLKNTLIQLKYMADICIGNYFQINDIKQKMDQLAEAFAQMNEIDISVIYLIPDLLCLYFEENTLFTCVRNIIDELEYNAKNNNAFMYYGKRSIQDIVYVDFQLIYSVLSMKDYLYSFQH
jgi:hypothetical protein